LDREADGVALTGQASYVLDRCHAEGRERTTVDLDDFWSKLDFVLMTIDGMEDQSAARRRWSRFSNATGTHGRISSRACTRVPIGARCSSGRFGFLREGQPMTDPQIEKLAGELIGSLLAELGHSQNQNRPLNFAGEIAQRGQN
jgi:hypothetical protein